MRPKLKLTERSPKFCKVFHVNCHQPSRNDLITREQLQLYHNFKYIPKQIAQHLLLTNKNYFYGT